MLRQSTPCGGGMITKKCSKCKKHLPATHEHFNKANWLPSGLRSDCKACYSASKKASYEKNAKPPNRDWHRRLKSELQRGLRTCKVCLKTHPATVEWFGYRGDRWETSCRMCVRKRVAKWRASNKERSAIASYARCAKRYADKRQRTPKWLSAEQKRAVFDIYARCKQLNEVFGPRQFAIDHIVPLCGKNVSGLHVPWNLQIIHRRENEKKHNKWCP